MASARYAPPAPSSIPAQPAYHGAPPASNAPPGTFAPGTKVQVGNHRVTIEKYLSEGGFAHVYLVRVPKTSDHAHTPDIAVLKRVAVPDREALANMRTEVETMKKLRGHKHIVTYIDSHASQLKGGGYEVFLLMEYCSGGGLIDFMNTRLQNRLTEPEILHIFSDVAEGVATMHYLRPPLLHRDLKVENVLITNSGSSRIYKLCDFGSTAPPRPAATTAAEARLIEEDVQRHTTLQYRSPEMIDVYRRQPIDEKSDIWALGVLLYKLCYYTTPFEEVGQMAILNASFKFPSYPQFSDRLKRLIASMLRENPQHRPNIYQVVVEVCSMRHRSVPIKDIYADRTQSQDRRNQQLPSTESSVASSPPVIGLQKVAPVQQVQMIPEVTPMRRGRPTAPNQQPSGAKPSPSPMRGTSSDPFAALDSQNIQVRSAAADELAARFPSLDEFSLLHDRGQKFEFSQGLPSNNVVPQDDLNKRVTQALADEAFAIPPNKKADSAAISKPASVAPSADQPSSAKQFRPPRESSRATASPLQQPTPLRPSKMVSTGTQTSPELIALPQPLPDVNKRPIWRVPDVPHHNRTLSTPRTFDKPLPSPSLKPDHTLPTRPTLLDSRTKSLTSTLTIPRSPASSRPSLEGQRPSPYDLGAALDRSKSANPQARPSSIHVESNLDYLRDREKRSSRNFDVSLLTQGPTSPPVQDLEADVDEKNIASNVDFLKSMEQDDAGQKKHRRSSSQSKHTKRSSLSSLTSNTKNIVKGKFGDAFRKFENNNTAGNRGLEPPLTPTDTLLDPSGKQLTPIAGSEATGDQSDDDRAIDETQDLPPEVKRELERRRLSQEEKRVANAAAEYKRRLAEQGDQGKGGKAGSTRASTIQNRVKSLLDDSQKSPTKTRTAEGYGHYTDTNAGKPLPPHPQELQGGVRSQPLAPPVARKPILNPSVIPAADLAYAKTRPGSSPSVPPAAGRATTGPQARPSAPPKPKALRTGIAGEHLPPSFSNTASLSRVATSSQNPQAPSTSVGAEDADFDVDSFSKRYPSLSGLELVETEIPPGLAPGASRQRVRDV
ncbi:uncharacterized protein EI97DRAFT_494712 [Westerdykella ornata]|uniref:non-specific serine/threonine protein kinase n=1 Tax=Westerdykella ornata TaxID=318751 RepID=A0A6A6JFV7_WESOR|nr:uncharacterized protein EI97DRAFT_494712 [Westerdykella ornata]KAF2275431.1 hypothetical protein EI97DRAFT_494712 [Westerdykella ornata]